MKALLHLIFAVFLTIALAPLPTAQAFDPAGPTINSCHLGLGPIYKAGYCGKYSNGTPPPPPPGQSCVVGASGYPACADAVSCTYFVSSSGSDSNSGTAEGSPFLTVPHAISVAASSPAGKVICLEGGSTFNVTSSITFSTADNGETLQFDPLAGANSATIDGGSTVDPIIINTGTNGIKINGIRVLHGNDGVIYAGSGDALTQNITIENSELAFNNHTSASGSFNPLVSFGNCKNCKYLHNYVHNAASQGLTFYAYNAGDTHSGDVIDSNVVLLAVQVMNDGGAIYVDSRNTNQGAGSLTITNNFARDYGSSSAQAECIYLDDDTSDATVSGNICGPRQVGAAHSLADNEINGGCCNTITNNILDEGGASGSAQDVASWSNAGGGGAIFFTWASPNTLKKNIIIQDWATDNVNGADSCPNGEAYCQGSGYPNSGAFANPISGNWYHNYGGGAIVTSGNVVGDSAPINLDPGCSSYLYNLSSPPTGWANIVGNWGPQGQKTAFVIPTSTNKGCPG